MTWLTTTLVSFAQTNQTAPTVEKAIATLPVENSKTDKDTDKGETRKPTGTVLTPNSKPIPIPSYDVELVSVDGRKIIATVLGFGGAVKIQTAGGRQHQIKWETLSWESVAKLTGQELSYDKVGMDAQWLPAGPPKCSRSR